MKQNELINNKIKLVQRKDSDQTGHNLNRVFARPVIGRYSPDLNFLYADFKCFDQTGCTWVQFVARTYFIHS